jgi:hypothetical protein
MVDHVETRTQRSSSPAASFKFSPNYSLWKDGLDRINEFIETDDVKFVVKGESITTTHSEAVLISPAVCVSLRTDPTSRIFVIIESNEVEDFRSFVEFWTTREVKDVPREKKIIFLNICRLLENEEVALVLLASHHTISKSGML